MESCEAAAGLGPAAATRGAGSTTVRILEVPPVRVLLTLSHTVRKWKAHCHTIRKWKAHCHTVRKWKAAPARMQ